MEPTELKASWVLSGTEGVNYVRSYMPARHLPGRCLRLAGTVDGKILLPNDMGAVIMQFPGFVHLGTFARYMQAAGFPVFFEADDNYLVETDVPETSSWRRYPDKNGCPSYDIARKIAEFCDGVITTTPRLAEAYAEVNDNVHVARNCVEPADWPRIHAKDDGVLRIGWTGSGSHEWDAPLLTEALRWLNGRSDVEVTIFGYPGFRDVAKWVPWTDSLSEFRQSISGLDVMLCPLQRTPFADCRSDLKALEGVMAGACAVVSDSPAYDLWHDNTHVAQGAQGWLSIVKHLVKNRDEVEQLKVLHRRYVLENRTIQTGVDQWRDAIASVDSSSAVMPRGTDSRVPESMAAAV